MTAPSTGRRAPHKATPAAGTSVSDPVARSVPRVFADDDFQFQFLFTVGQAYERAAAAFFADGTHDPSHLVPTWEAHRAAFDAFAARLTPLATPVAIPYQDTTLPGYALTVDPSRARRPWLIMNNGSDGTRTRNSLCGR